MDDVDALMLRCVENAWHYLGPDASKDDVQWTAVLIFGLAAGLWCEINPTLH